MGRLHRADLRADLHGRRLRDVARARATRRASARGASARRAATRGAARRAGTELFERFTREERTARGVVEACELPRRPGSRAERCACVRSIGRTDVAALELLLARRGARRLVGERIGRSGRRARRGRGRTGAGRARAFGRRGARQGRAREEGSQQGSGKMDPHADDSGLPAGSVHVSSTADEFAGADAARSSRAS